jgi:hypothetical protein
MKKSTEKHSLRDAVLERIERDAIQPRPVWYYLLHEWSIRVSATIALGVGSLATALTIYLLDVNRFAEQQTITSPWSVVFSVLPWVWLVILGVALFYTVHAFRETRRGYRYNSKWLVLGAVVMSVVFGSGLYAMGLGEKVDDYLLAEAPFYQPITGFHYGRWMNMESGVLAGTILNVEDTMFSLHAVSGDIVTVRVTENTIVRPFGGVVAGAQVRVVGTTTKGVVNEEGGIVFEAYEVRPFVGRGGRMHGRHSGQEWGTLHRMKENGRGMRMNE